jgi:hypothetical protein
MQVGMVAPRKPRVIDCAKSTPFGQIPESPKLRRSSGGNSRFWEAVSAHLF